MSTRCSTRFGYGDNTIAIVYRHCDGYPECHGRYLQDLFVRLRDAPFDGRLDDPSYLAAKLVVDMSRGFGYDPDEPLDFLGVGIMLDEQGDEDYIYHVDTETHIDGIPTITVECGDRRLPLNDMLPQEE